MQAFRFARSLQEGDVVIDGVAEWRVEGIRNSGPVYRVYLTEKDNTPPRVLTLRYDDLVTVQV